MKTHGAVKVSALDSVKLKSPQPENYRWNNFSIPRRTIKGLFFADFLQIFSWQSTLATTFQRAKSPADATGPLGKISLGSQNVFHGFQNGILFGGDGWPQTSKLARYPPRLAQHERFWGEGGANAPSTRPVERRSTRNRPLSSVLPGRNQFTGPVTAS